MLVDILARQSREQSQWLGLRASSSYRQRVSKHEEVPPHDLSPPKFAQKALNLVLEDWRCVKAALLSGVDGETGKEQSCTLSLDALAHTVLAKLNQEVSSALCVQAGR